VACQEQLSRRAALLAVALSAAAAVPLGAATPASLAADALTAEELFPGSTQGAVGVDGQLRFTHKVSLDVGVCATSVRQDRKLGDKSILCTDPEPLGRIIIGELGIALFLSDFFKGG
jgi:hypothetical protein